MGGIWINTVFPLKSCKTHFSYHWVSTTHTHTHTPDIKDIRGITKVKPEGHLTSVLCQQGAMFSFHQCHLLLTVQDLQRRRQLWRQSLHNQAVALIPSVEAPTCGTISRGIPHKKRNSGSSQITKQPPPAPPPSPVKLRSDITMSRDPVTSMTRVPGSFDTPLKGKDSHADNAAARKVCF